MFGLTAIQMALAVAALAVGGTVAGAVLVTSGPLAGDDDTPLAAESVTQAATNAPTTVPTLEPTRTPTAAPTPGQVDAEGWPVIECAPGTSAVRMDVRKVTACIPSGWDTHTSNYTGTPEGLYGTSLAFRAQAEPGEQGDLGSVAVIEKSSGDAQSLFASVFACLRPVDTEVFGHPGRMCIAKLSEQDENGMGLANHTWMIRAYADAGALTWVRFEAAGFEVGAEEVDAAIERALRILAGTRTGALETVK